MSLPARYYRWTFYSFAVVMLAATAGAIQAVLVASMGLSVPLTVFAVTAATFLVSFAVFLLLAELHRRSS